MKKRLPLLTALLSAASWAGPATQSFQGTYECAALTRDLPDRRSYFRHQVKVILAAGVVKVSFREPNRGEVAFGGGPLVPNPTGDGVEWRSGDNLQYIAMQKTEVGRFLTLTHQDGKFRYSAGSCMKK